MTKYNKSASRNNSTSKVAIPRWVVVLFVGIIVLVGILFIYNSFAIGGPNGDTPPNNNGSNMGTPTTVWCTAGVCYNNPAGGNPQSAFKRRNPSCAGTGYEYRPSGSSGFKNNNVNRNRQPTCIRKYVAPPVTSPDSCTGTPNVPVAGIGGGVCSTIAPQVQRMIAAAARDGVTLQGNAYRTYAQQQDRYANRRPGVPVAVPGTSMHEQGLAIDFTVYDFDWLSAHAATYGFYNLPSEPWHWSTNGH